MADQAPRFAGRISDWILRKDKQLLVFNKPAGLLTQGDGNNSPNLLAMASAYAHHDLYPINRLDRPVSGVVLFAKKASAQTHLNEQFKRGTTEKVYLAITAGRPEEEEGELVHYLRPRKNNVTEVVGAEDAGAKESRLRYRYLGASDRYHLLEITLITGRKHQIRAQLAAIGCPIRGDEKYGFKRANPDGGIDLHSYHTSYKHPTSGKRMEHTAPAPGGPVWEAFSEYID